MSQILTQQFDRLNKLHYYNPLFSLSFKTVLQCRSKGSLIMTYHFIPSNSKGCSHQKMMKKIYPFHFFLSRCSKMWLNIIIGSNTFCLHGNFCTGTPSEKPPMESKGYSIKKCTGMAFGPYHLITQLY